LIWPHIFSKKQEISFAYLSFPWSNSAKSKAAVICSIIGIRNKSDKPKFLFTKSTKKSVENINAYLANGKDIIIEKHSSSISRLPLMTNGNIPRDQGNFMLNEQEKIDLENNYPFIKSSIKRIVGSSEFLNNTMRWCLWIEDEHLIHVSEIKEVKNRLSKIREYRINGSDRGKSGIETPHRFERTLICQANQIVIPRVSSERRKYIPVGFLEKDVIISDAALVIFDPEPYILGIISSNMHMAWVKTVAGRLKSDFRYSVGVCYNSFPFPSISDQRKQEITQCVFRILEEREKHSEKTLAQLYDPDKMPEGLREAHRQNDLAIERCYRSKPFESDEERLEYLFKLYEKMIAEEEEKNTLFAKEKKSKKVRK
jgi:hypothetical protein